MDKREILRKRKNFDKVFLKGRKAGNSYFSLYYNNNGFQYSRFAVIVKSKTGKAYKRNRLKRITRAIYRSLKTELKNGFDFIIVILADFSALDHKDIKTYFSEVFRKSGLLISG